MGGAPLLLPLVRLDALNGASPVAAQPTSGACPHCGVDPKELIERTYQRAYDEIEHQIDIAIDRRYPR